MPKKVEINVYLGTIIGNSFKYKRVPVKTV